MGLPILSVKLFCNVEFLEGLFLNVNEDNLLNLLEDILTAINVQQRIPFQDGV